MTAAFERVATFHPLRPRRLHEDVAEQLRDAILDGRYAAGDRLPAERELAAEFRVNRTSVREALKTLEGLGLVQIRQGDGVRVRPLVDASLDILAPMIFHAGRIDLALLGELREVGGFLLWGMARVAVERAEEADIAALRSLRDAIADPSLDTEARFAAGRRVLVLLADVTRNRVWQMLARRLRILLASDALRETRRRLNRDPGIVVPALDQCLEALAAGDSRHALRAVREVLRVLGEQGQASGADADPDQTSSRKGESA